MPHPALAFSRIFFPCPALKRCPVARRAPPAKSVVHAPPAACPLHAPARPCASSQHNCWRSPVGRRALRQRCGSCKLAPESPRNGKHPAFSGMLRCPPPAGSVVLTSPTCCVCLHACASSTRLPTPPSSRRSSAGREREVVPGDSVAPSPRAGPRTLIGSGACAQQCPLLGKCARLQRCRH